MLANASALHVSGLDVLADQAVQQSSKGTGGASTAAGAAVAAASSTASVRGGSGGASKGVVGAAGAGAKKRDHGTAFGGGGDAHAVQTMHALQALHMQGMMAAYGHPAMMGWGGAGMVPWLLQEPEGQVYKYGTDMHGIEKILKSKMRKFNAEEGHEEWCARFFRAHDMHTRIHVPQPKPAAPAVVPAADAASGVVGVAAAGDAEAEAKKAGKPDAALAGEAMAASLRAAKRGGKVGITRGGRGKVDGGDFDDTSLAEKNSGKIVEGYLKGFPPVHASMGSAAAAAAAAAVAAAVGGVATPGYSKGISHAPPKPAKGKGLAESGVAGGACVLAAADAGKKDAKDAKSKGAGVGVGAAAAAAAAGRAKK